MPDGDGSIIAVLACLLFASVLFQVAFAAINSANKTKISLWANNGSKSAIAIEKGLASTRLDATLTALETIFDASVAALITIFILRGEIAGVIEAVVFVCFATVIWIIVGKYLPRNLGRKAADRLALRLFWLIQIATFLLLPITAMMMAFVRLLGISKDHGAMTETELKNLVFASTEEGVIEESEREMISNVFDFQDNSAVDVMVPRTEITALHVDSSYESTLELFRTKPFSRIPVYDNDMDDIIGILHFKDFMFASSPSGFDNGFENSIENSFDLRKLVRPAFFSYETKSTAKLLAQMREGRITMAVILDEYGGTLGLVTIQDLIEEIVGEITDEYDEPDADDIDKIDRKTFIVEGAVKIDDFNDCAGTMLSSLAHTSIAGVVMELSGAIPDVGDVIVSDDGITFVVEQMDRNRIKRLRVELGD